MNCSSGAFFFFFLDMKGSPPKMSYLTKLFPLIRKVINRKQFLFSSLLFSHKECLRASSVGTLKQLYSVFQKNCVLRCAQFLSLSITWIWMNIICMIKENDDYYSNTRLRFPANNTTRTYTNKISAIIGSPITRTRHKEFCKKKYHAIEFAIA